MTQQVETATVLGTITGTGNASATVTANSMGNSPKEVSVPVTNGMTASEVAKEVRYWLALDSDVADFFQVSGTGANVVLTAREAAADDATINIAIDNDTCTGLTAAPTSTNTTAGVAEITNGYATLDDYKSWISMRGQAGVTIDDTSDDDVICMLIEAASRYVDRETGHRFYMNSVDETRYYTTDNSTCVKVDDLAEITSVSVDYSGARSYTALVSTDYDPTPDNAALDGHPYTRLEINPLASSAFFPEHRRGVRVVGKFGYPETPQDIKEAVISIAQSLNGARSGQASQGKVSVTAGGIIIRPEDVSVFAQRVIAHYRDMV